MLACRPKDKKSAKERMCSLLQSFDNINDVDVPNNREEHIAALEYDLNSLWKDEHLLQNDLLKHKESIAHLFHCAASIKFELSLQDAAKNVIAPTLTLQNITKSLMPSARLTCFSASFVNTQIDFIAKEELPNKMFSSYEDAYEAHKSMILANQNALASSIMHQCQLPNAYAFD